MAASKSASEAASTHLGDTAVCYTHDGDVIIDFEAQDVGGMCTHQLLPLISTAIPGDASESRAIASSHPRAKPVFTDGLRVPAWYTNPNSIRSHPSKIYLSFFFLSFDVITTHNPK